MDLNESGLLPRQSDGFADNDGGGYATASTRTETETLEYVSALVIDLRALADGAGWERLATLLALAHYEVRGLLAKGPGERVKRP